MTKKRKIYISIPITGLDERTQRAKADALYVRSVITPMMQNTASNPV